MFREIFILAFCVALTAAIPDEAEFEKCGDDFRCAEDKLISIVDEYDSNASLSIVGDVVTVERTNDVRTVAGENEGLYERVARYLSCHRLKLNFPQNSRAGRTIAEEMRSGKLKKIMLPLLLLLKLKAVILIPIVLSAIALVAFKGLGAGLIALALSGATAFKSVLEGHQAKKVSFEVIPPHWSRAGYASAPAAVFQEFYPYQTIPQ